MDVLCQDLEDALDYAVNLWLLLFFKNVQIFFN